MKNIKITIETRGGCVVAAYSSDPSTEIEVIDWDDPDGYEQILAMESRLADRLSNETPHGVL